MDLLSALSSGRESLMSHGTALATVSDNLANSNTVGYKTDRTEFAGLLSQAMGGIYSTEETQNLGSGVEVTNVSTIFNQGSIEDTERSLDMAIDGEGFFVVSNGTDTYYTRAGNFTTDADGNLVTQDGLKVMGYASGDTSTLTSLQVSSTFVSPQASTTATITGNLDARSEVNTIPASAQSFSALNSAAQFHTVASVTDSMGQQQDIDLYFYKTGSNAWTVQAYNDASESGGTAGTPVLVGSTTLSFDQNGALTSGGSTTLTANATWLNAGTSSVAIDLSGFHQTGSSSAVTMYSSNGDVGGNLTGIEIEEDGTILGTVESGATTTLGTIAVAKFVNTDSLKKEGDNLFSATADTKVASIGSGDAQGRGEVKGNALEYSTVDTASEFIDMVKYQRGYQAGSQVVQTMSDLLNTTIEIA